MLSYPMLSSGGYDDEHRFAGVPGASLSHIVVFAPGPTQSAERKIARKRTDNGADRPLRELRAPIKAEQIPS